MLSGIAVFGAITMASGGAFEVASRVITAEVASSLSTGAGRLPSGPELDADQICAALWASSVSVPTSFVLELMRPDGSVCRVPGPPAVVATGEDRAVARAGAGGGVRDDATVDGQELRVRVNPLPGGYAVLVARSLRDTHEVLRELRCSLFLSSIVGAFAALGIGLVVARAGLRPIGRLASAVEDVVRTQDLEVQLEVTAGPRRDEVARLAERSPVRLDSCSTLPWNGSGVALVVDISLSSPSPGSSSACSTASGAGTTHEACRAAASEWPSRPTPLSRTAAVDKARRAAALWGGRRIVLPRVPSLAKRIRSAGPPRPSSAAGGRWSCTARRSR